MQNGLLDLWGPMAHAEALHALTSRLLDLGRSQWAERSGELTTAFLTAALCPHGPLNATGLATARALAPLSAETWPEVFVVVATSHHAPRPAALTADVRTALGTIRTDRPLLDAIRAHADAPSIELTIDDPIFLVEHSWKQDLPLLQALAQRFDKPLRIVALLAGTLDFDAARALGRGIDAALWHRRQRGCLWLSGDLSHFGHGYRWRPDWLESTGRVTDVIEAIERFERPILDAICARDVETVRRAIPTTGFCAREHLGTLLELGFGEGRFLGTETVLNDRRVDASPDRPWRDDDRLFRGGSLGFYRPTATPGSVALCADVLIRRQSDRLLLSHRCTNDAIALPADAEAVLDALSAGAADRATLVTAAHRAAPTFDIESLRTVIETLDSRDWLHRATDTGPPAHVRSRVPRALADYRRRIPYYRERLRSNDLRRAPVLDSTRLREDATRFIADEAPREIRDDTTVARRSSGSTAAPGTGGLITVESRSIVAARLQATRLVGRHDHRQMASINRPANLGFRATAETMWPLVRIDPDGYARLSPGADPATVDDEIWDRLLSRLRALRPRTLEGDPAYLHAFALRCRAVGATIEGLERVQLSHTFAWSLFVRTLESVFGVPVERRVITSEVGDVTATCPLGREHLIESHLACELRRRGRNIRPGGVGALVVTTLDASLRPLVRYRTGDLLRLIAQRCPCGRPFRVVDFTGRVGDLFADDTGRPVTVRDLDDALGAPAGVRFFRLTIASDQVDVDIDPLGARELVDLDGPLERLARLTDRPVRIGWPEGFELAPTGGKPRVLNNLDRSTDWPSTTFPGTTRRSA